MTTPTYLKEGDKVGIVSTAKRCEPHEINDGLALLKSWRLHPVLGKNAFASHGFLAGTDEERLSDLQQMLDDITIKAIFFTKGGYGTLRIIDSIDWTAFKANPKWLVGYSDITLLHSHIHNFGIESLHAVMLQGIPNSNAASSETIRVALFGESLSYNIQNLPDNKTAPGILEGILVGGNLSMMYGIVGSGSDIDTNGKILFIEDIDEYLYHYDRMLISLKRAGKLSGIKALLVGGMVDIKESTIPFGKNDTQITLEHFDCPVYFGIPSGHTDDNRALIMGRNISISHTAQTVTLKFDN
ncbi:LD-carboxypeptidase [Flavobacterium cerinum]|uniref:LD-carboxypeptidase n=2 Tax=Flavobacterium cerinum TaxID=2502784 RepID=A0A3S3QA07_9FLAO|nr:LD-carboxypeptidase [Flavobacterium cerinum]